MTKPIHQISSAFQNSKDTEEKTKYSLVDEIEEWGKKIISMGLMSKKSWDSLTYFQQMCEIAAIKESLSKCTLNPLSYLYGNFYY